ncbi:MAG: hypothetical protein PWR27_1208 [Petroclostridium sp.]|jgi:hypothetical protein|uniref:ATP-binding protein n=1 Tax=Petroclostridium xylanilyticum TaxID=1792311 RepID=UPI000B99638A|nr:ATP-binding protein [Petroclostridium xylanilyticum]MBZ4646423.1 sensor histidine kinase [Clostridia bacterium]MDK2810499.1 hypothetical protein [Petroclostridium sp.]
MRELSLHILDIVQNSISANATLIAIEVKEDLKQDILEFCITDNGKGMTQELLKTVSDPFVTTRSTRKVGLGISLLKSAAELCGGGVEISSEPGKGTKVKARFLHSHIDRAPLGNMVETVLTLVVCNPLIDFVYKHLVNENCFEFDTREIKQVIKEVDINNTEVVSWMKDCLTEGITSLYGGVS